MRCGCSILECIIHTWEKLMATPDEILKEAITLRPLDQAKLVDQLIVCLDTPDPELDKLWAEEVESRLEAFKNGSIQSVTLESVLSKYK